MNTASNTRLRLNYPSWSRPRSHWSATDPRNQQATFQAKTHPHAQQKLVRLATCATPVRPMACAGQTGDTGQTGRVENGRKRTEKPHFYFHFYICWWKRDRVRKMRVRKMETGNTGARKRTNTDGI
jgi:hypothetical protein